MPEAKGGSSSASIACLSKESQWPSITKEEGGDPLVGRLEQLHEGRVIAVVVEDGGAGVAPVQDVVATAASGSACGAGHVGNAPGRSRMGKRNLECPLSAPPFRPRYFFFFFASFCIRSRTSRSSILAMRL